MCKNRVRVLEGEATVSCGAFFGKHILICTNCRAEAGSFARELMADPDNPQNYDVGDRVFASVALEDGDPTRPVERQGVIVGVKKCWRLYLRYVIRFDDGSEQELYWTHVTAHSRRESFDFLRQV